MAMAGLSCLIKHFLSSGNLLDALSDILQARFAPLLNPLATRPRRFPRSAGYASSKLHCWQMTHRLSFLPSAWGKKSSIFFYHFKPIQMSFVAFRRKC